MITLSLKKNDRNDAETLARLARADIGLLSAGGRAQEHLAIVQARARLVEARTALVNHVRGTVKAHGERLPGCSATAFARKAEQGLPQGLRAALLPLLEAISWHTEQIQRYDREVERLGREEYPESGVLRQVVGVGPLTALPYMLTLEDKGRFAKSRHFFGTPRPFAPLQPTRCGPASATTQAPHASCLIPHSSPLPSAPRT